MLMYLVYIPLFQLAAPSSVIARDVFQRFLPLMGYAFPNDD